MNLIVLNFLRGGSFQNLKYKWLINIWKHVPPTNPLRSPNQHTHTMTDTHPLPLTMDFVHIAPGKLTNSNYLASYPFARKVAYNFYLI